MQQNRFKRKVYSNTTLHQEIRKTSNRQPNFTPKTTGKRRTKQRKHDNSKPMDAAKAVLKRKYIAIQSYLKKQEKYQINSLTLHLK